MNSFPQYFFLPPKNDSLTVKNRLNFYICEFKNLNLNFDILYYCLRWSHVAVRVTHDLGPDNYDTTEQIFISLYFPRSGKKKVKNIWAMGILIPLFNVIGSIY